MKKRVAITPQGLDALISYHHRALVERKAGDGSGFSDMEYEKAGANIVEKKESIWNKAEMIVKVKEPLEAEFPLMTRGQILFTFLQLAADRELTNRLIERRIVGIGYETIQKGNKTDFLRGHLG